MEGAMRGVYDATAMSSHFPDFLDDDTFGLDSYEDAAITGISAGGFGYAPQPHAVQQYADAQYMPDVSSVTQISAPGYASAGYISAVQSMPSLDDLVGNVADLLEGPAAPAQSFPAVAKREQDLGAVASNGQLASGASSRPGSEASSRDRKRSAVQAQLETEEPAATLLKFPTSETPASGGRMSAVDLEQVIGLKLLTADELQCRFAVKNDGKDTNQLLSFVQRNGYIEYKARYCKKRGGHLGYGHFWLGSIPMEKCVFPLAQPKEGPHGTPTYEILRPAEVQPWALRRVEITARLFQSFRGQFPTKLYRFHGDEVYHPLHVHAWQGATMMETAPSKVAGLTVHASPDGDAVRYTCEDPKTLRSISDGGGIKFPCPVPTHPERLNDIGMLRMQVSAKFFMFSGKDSSSGGTMTVKECAVWVKVKVVQQLSGKKRKFSNMLREPGDTEWCIPPFPEIVTGSKPPAVVRHLLGEHGLGVKASIDLMTVMATEMLQKKQDMTVNTPAMHSAIVSGSLGMVRLFLQIDLEQVHVRDGMTEDTSMHIAAQCGHKEIVVALFQSGASLQQLNAAGETPEVSAREAGHVSLADDLLAWHQAEFPVGSVDIFRVAGTGVLPSLRELMSSGVSLNVVNCEGQTPLMLATAGGHPATVAILLQRGADIHARDRQGVTALHMAARGGHASIMLLLLRHDAACLDAVDAKGFTAHHHAAAGNGRPLCVQILLLAGLQTNFRDSDGRTAADVALVHGRHVSRHLLLNASEPEPSDLPTSPRGPRSRSPLSPRGGSAMARPTTIPVTMDESVLTAALAGKRDPMHYAAATGSVTLIRMLVEWGYPICELDHRGKTPLRCALDCGNLSALDELLTAHAKSESPADSPDVLAPDGFSPMHAAAYHNNVEAIVLLLTSKLFNVNGVGLNGSTPLQIAVERGALLPVMFLMMGGAKRSPRNSAGQTAAEIAASNKSDTIEAALGLSRASLEALSNALDDRAKSGILWGSKAGHVPNECDATLEVEGLAEIMAEIWVGVHSLRSVLEKIRLDYALGDDQ